MRIFASAFTITVQFVLKFLLALACSGAVRSEPTGLPIFEILIGGLHVTGD